MKHLAIVDDDPAILDIFQLIFNTHYAVSAYQNPAPLFSLKSELPDLIFLDRQLIGMDGLEVCRRLKSRPQTRHIPIIMLSVSTGIGRLARAAGAVDAIEKPFSIQSLRDAVKNTLAI
jgi:CheY-like chemotaxis protein